MATTADKDNASSIDNGHGPLAKHNINNNTHNNNNNNVGLDEEPFVDRIEAPVTIKAYLLCAFASFGGIFFGYDSGYINGVTGSKVFISIIEGSPIDSGKTLTASHNSLIVSILSAGTFFGTISYFILQVHSLTKPI